MSINSGKKVSYSVNGSVINDLPIDNQRAEKSDFSQKGRSLKCQRAGGFPFKSTA